jgi:polysaccharide export outer membrane protein
MSAAYLFVSLLALAPQVRPAAAQDPGAPASDYQIGPDDILKITVYGHEDLTQAVVVQPDGTFAFPLIGRVEAKDLTPRELEKLIAERLLRGFIKSPQVTVVVSEYRSKMVFVVGEVVRPGTYPLTGGTTVVELLSKAGPMTPAASSEVVVVRPRGNAPGPLLPSDVGADGDAGPARLAADVFRVNVRDIQAGDIEKNLRLHPGDTVFVPVAPKIFVSGEVRSPGGFAFVAGMTVRQAVSLAGGFTEDGSSGGIRVVREVQGKPKEVKLKLDDRLLPGDTIVVKAKLF